MEVKESTFAQRIGKLLFSQFVLSDEEKTTLLKAIGITFGVFVSSLFLSVVAIVVVAIISQ